MGKKDVGKRGVGKRGVGKKIEGRMRHIVTDTEGPPAAAGTSQDAGGMPPPQANRALPLPRSLFGGSIESKAA